MNSQLYMDTGIKFEKKIGKEFKLKEYFYKQMEDGWNGRFTVKYSKDNIKFHKTQREYFDSMKRFDRFYRDRFEELAAFERVISTRGTSINNRKSAMKVSKSHRVLIDTSNKKNLFYPVNKKLFAPATKKISVLEL